MRSLFIGELRQCLVAFDRIASDVEHVSPAPGQHVTHQLMAKERVVSSI